MMAHPLPPLFRARGGPIFLTGAARNGRRTLRPHAQPAAPLRLHRGDMPGGAGMGDVDAGSSPDGGDLPVMVLRDGAAVMGVRRPLGWIGLVPASGARIHPDLLILLAVGNVVAAARPDGEIESTPPPPASGVGGKLEAFGRYIETAIGADAVLAMLRAPAWMKVLTRLPDTFPASCFTAPLVQHFHAAVIGDDPNGAQQLRASRIGFFDQLWEATPWRGRIDLAQLGDFLQAMASDDPRRAIFKGTAAKAVSDAAPRDLDALLLVVREHARRRDKLLADILDKLRRGEWHATAIEAADAKRQRSAIDAGFWDDPRMAVHWRANEMRPQGEGAERMPFFRDMHLLPCRVGHVPAKAGANTLPNVDGIPKSMKDARALAGKIDEAVKKIVDDSKARLDKGEDHHRKSYWRDFFSARGPADSGDGEAPPSFSSYVFDRKVWPLASAKEPRLREAGRPKVAE